MLQLILVSIYITSVTCKHRAADASGDLGGSLVTQLRNDVNLDLSVDEDYEDLRAELLAYHTALAALTSGRRSMKTTPCWQLGGICVDHKMCEGHKSLSEVPGCKDKLEVCCFTWNNYQVRDTGDKDIGVLAMPWSRQTEVGGKGIIDIRDLTPRKQKRRPRIKPEPLFPEKKQKKKKSRLGKNNKENKPPLLVIVRTD